MWQNWVFAFGGAFTTTASRVRFSFWLFPCCWKCVRPLQKSASHSESTFGPHIYKMGPTWVLATDGKTQISRSILFCRKGKPLITHLPYGRANVTIQLHNLDILLSNEQPNPVGISLQFLTNSYQIFLHHVTAGSWRSPRGPNTNGWGGKISIFWSDEGGSWHSNSNIQWESFFQVDEQGNHERERLSCLQVTESWIFFVTAKNFASQMSCLGGFCGD